MAHGLVQAIVMTNTPHTDPIMMMGLYCGFMAYSLTIAILLTNIPIRTRNPDYVSIRELHDQAGES